MNFKRFLSLLLCFALVLPSLPLQVKADDPLVIGKSIFEKVATITIRPDKYGLDMAGLSAAGEVATFELSLDDIYAYSVMVDYRTLAGAARPGDHYEHVEGTVVFQPGETTKTVSVNIHWFKAGTTSDDRWEGAYPFFVQFTNPVNATIDTRETQIITDLQATHNWWRGHWYTDPDGRSASYLIYLTLTNVYELITKSTGHNSFRGFIDMTHGNTTTPDYVWSKENIAGYFNTGAFDTLLEDSNATFVRFGIDMVPEKNDGLNNAMCLDVRLRVSIADANRNSLFDEKDYEGNAAAMSWGYNNNQYHIPFGEYDPNNVVIQGTAYHYLPRTKYQTLRSTNQFGFNVSNFHTFDDALNETTSGTIDLTVINALFATADFISPELVDVHVPVADYHPGDYVPVTLEFDEPVQAVYGSIPGFTSLKINGVDTEPCVRNDQDSDTFGKYITYMYKIQELDNTTTLLINIGNVAISDRNSPEPNMIKPVSTIATVSHIYAPQESSAIINLQADKASYSMNDTIAITLTDSNSDKQNQWLRNTVQSDMSLHGAYLAVYNEVYEEVGSYGFTLATSGGANTSSTYVAQIPVRDVYTLSLNTLHIALMYGSDVKVSSGTFSGGKMDYTHQLNIPLVKPVMATSVVIDTNSLPAGNTINYADIFATRLMATAFPANTDFPEITWSSSNTSIAEIDPKTGIIYQNRSGSVTFAATAKNGDLAGATPAIATTDVITIKGSDVPVLVIPQGADIFRTLQGEDLTVRWMTNIAEFDGNANYSLKLYAAGNPNSAKTFTFTASDRATYTISGSELSQLSSVDGNLDYKPAYEFEISWTNPQDPSNSLSATGKVIVYPQPASIQFSSLENNYVTDATTSIDLGWLVQHVAGSPGGAFRLTVNKNGEVTPIYETTDATSQGYQLPIELVNENELVDTYRVIGIASNATGQSIDSMDIYVYNDDALKILVQDATGQLENTSGGFTLSNRNYIATKYNTEKSQGILDLKRDINLQRFISINYSAHAWNSILDQIAWLADDTAVASVNYQLGSLYEPLSSFAYNKYAPSTLFALAGEGNGSTSITATHSLTRQQVELDVTVETLKDQLFIFQFYPREVTQVRYTNGNGATIDVDSNAEGMLAIYEPSGIASNVKLQSVFNSNTYLATIYAQDLISGEQNSANKGLYPINIVQLRNTKLDLYLTMPDGTPFAGDISFSAAVYKNGILAPNSVLRSETVAVVSNGHFLYNFDASTFWINSSSEALGLDDVLTFEAILEKKGSTAYYPIYISLNGHSYSKEIIRLGENTAQFVANSQNAPNPYIAWQIFRSPSLYYDHNVLHETEHVGPSNRVPVATLQTSVLWWGEQPSNSHTLILENEYGTKLEAQTVNSRMLPFYDATLTTNEANLSNNTIGLGTAFDLSAGDETGLQLKLMRQSQEVLASRSFPFRLTNAVGLVEPENDPKLKTLIKELENIENPESGFKASMLDDKTAKHAMEAMKILEYISKPAALSVQVEYLPTSNPYRYKAFITAGAAGYSFAGGKGEISSGFTAENISVTGSFYVEADIVFWPGAKVWEMEVTGGGFYVKASAGHGGALFYTLIPTPIPITVQMGLNFGADIAGQFQESEVYGKVNRLVTSRLEAAITGQVGFGFDADIIAAFVGFYGALIVDIDSAALFFYTKYYPDNLQKMGGNKVSLRGELGVMAEITFLFFSRSFTYTILEGTILSVPFGSWNEIRDWVAAHYIPDVLDTFDLDQITTTAFNLNAAGRQDEATAFLYSVAGYSNGMQLKVETTPWTTDSRSYLHNGTRIWGTDALPLQTMLMGANANLAKDTLIQANAYPYSAPLVTDDGQIMAYRSDGDSQDLNASNISWASFNGTTYVNQGTIDSDAHRLPAASNFALAGTSAFAVAAWEAQNTPIPFVPDQEISDFVMDYALNNTELVAAMFNGSSWSTTRLTTDTQADMGPVVAASATGDVGFVAWRGLAGTGTVDGEANFGGVSNSIMCSVFQGTAWSTPKVLLNAQDKSIVSMNAAVLNDGTIALVYVVNPRMGDTDLNSSEIYCLLLTKDGNIISLVRLTNDNATDTNAQVIAADFSVLGLNSQNFVIAWHRADDTPQGDLRLVALDSKGAYVEVFENTVSTVLGKQNLGIGSDYRLAPEATGKLQNLGILWHERKDGSSATSSASTELYGAKLTITSPAQTYFTAPQLVWSTPAEHQLRTVDGWYNTSSSTINAVMSVTDYAYQTLKNTGHPGETYMHYASASFTDGIEADATFNLAEIVHDFDTTIFFSVTNSGSNIVDAITVKTGDGSQSAAYGGLTLLPNQTIDLPFVYRVPAAPNSIKDTEFTIQAAASSTNLLLDLAVPDIGITSIDLLDASEGIRTFEVSLQNLSDIELYQNTDDYVAYLGVYTDQSMENIAKNTADQPMLFTLTPAELGLLDDSALTKVLKYRLPDSGFSNGNIRLYGKVWITEDGTEVAQFYDGNDLGSIVFTDPVAANGGNPIKLSTEQSNATGVSVAKVTATNLGFAPLSNGNILVSLLDDKGKVMETQLLAKEAKDLISLGKEQSKAFTFTFASAGYSVKAAYYVANPSKMDAELASLELSAITMAFDPGVDDYSLTAKNLAGTTLMAAAVNPKAKLKLQNSVGDILAEAVGALSHTIALPAGATTGLTLSVEPEDSSAQPKDYSLSIANNITDAEGLVVKLADTEISLTLHSNSSFVPTEWQLNIDGTWTTKQPWLSAANTYLLGDTEYTALYARAYDVDGRFMESNTLSGSSVAAAMVTFMDGSAVYATKAVSPTTFLVADFPANPAKSGYTFAGWWTNVDGTGSEFTATTVVAMHTNVYAKWQPSGGGYIAPNNNSSSSGGSTAPSSTQGSKIVLVGGKAYTVTELDKGLTLSLTLSGTQRAAIIAAADENVLIDLSDYEGSSQNVTPQTLRLAAADIREFVKAGLGLTLAFAHGTISIPAEELADITSQMTGTSLDITLTVITFADLDEAVQARIKALLLAMGLDITPEQLVFFDIQLSSGRKLITELADLILITLNRAMADGYEPVVLHFHGEELIIVKPVTYSSDDETVAFTTDGLSIFALGQLATVEDPSPDETKPPVENEKPDAAETLPIILTIDSDIVRQGETLLAKPPVAPQIINSRAMLPFRYLIQTLLGGTVDWHEDTRTVTATINGIEFAMTIDNPTMTIDGETIIFDQAPVIVGDYTLVPLRVFEKAVQSIQWLETTHEVHILLNADSE